MWLAVGSFSGLYTPQPCASAACTTTRSAAQQAERDATGLAARTCPRRAACDVVSRSRSSTRKRRPLGNGTAPCRRADPDRPRSARRQAIDSGRRRYQMGARHRGRLPARGQLGIRRSSWSSTTAIGLRPDPPDVPGLMRIDAFAPVLTWLGRTASARIAGRCHCRRNRRPDLAVADAPAPTLSSPAPPAPGRSHRSPRARPRPSP